MNRFSQNQTLSKFATAVRETVDFLTITIRAHVVLLAIVTAALSIVASENVSAQALTVGNQQLQTIGPTLNERKSAVQEHCKPGSPTADLCEAAKAGYSWALNPGQQVLDEAKRRAEEKKETQCLSLSEKLGTLGKDAKTSCVKAGLGGNLSSCFDKATACFDAEQAVGEIEPDDMPNEQAYCNRILANTCPGLPTFNAGLNYKTEKSDAERERKEAQRRLDELLKEERDQKKQTAAQQREILEAQQQAAYDARKQERELANDLKSAFEGISNQQKKAFEDAQQAFEQMDAQYIKMRREARQYADAVSQAEDDLNSTCRAVAQKKFDEAEKVRLAASKKGPINVGSAVSGSTQRRRAAKNRARQGDYLAFFNECNGGASPEGTAARNAIKTAQRAKATNEATLLEQAALIESNRERMLKQLKNMEEDAKNQESKVVENINERMTAMSEQQQLVASQNQARIAEFNQNSSNAMMTTGKEIQTANQELNEAQKKVYLATNQEHCAGKAGKLTPDRLDKIGEGFMSAGGDIEVLAKTCQDAKNNCSATASFDSQGVCSSAIAAFYTKDKDRERKKRAIKDMGTVN